MLPRVHRRRSLAAGLHPPRARARFTLAEIGELLGPAEARSTGDIVQAAEAKLAGVAAQIQELLRLQGRLRHLIQVREHGDADACVVLQLTSH